VTRTAPRVVNTRPEDADGPLARALRSVGLESVPCPMLSIAPPEDPQPFLVAVGQIAEFDWVAFTSGHAVEAVSKRPEWREALARGTLPRVAAVGDASARRLADQGIAVEVVPDGAGAAALADAIVRASGVMDGMRVLWPRGSRAFLTFGEEVEKAGAMVTSPIAYRTLPAPDGSTAALMSEIEANRLAAIAFCSPSSARNLADSLALADLSILRHRVQIASIGPTTTAALRELGVEVDVQAAEPSMTRLAEAIAERLRVTAGPRV
jgi:uroporphyrinogen-III synthase